MAEVEAAEVEADEVEAPELVDDEDGGEVSAADDEVEVEDGCHDSDAEVGEVTVTSAGEVKST